jgi:hypothetical protein
MVGASHTHTPPLAVVPDGHAVRVSRVDDWNVAPLEVCKTHVVSVLELYAVPANPLNPAKVEAKLVHAPT